MEQITVNATLGKPRRERWRGRDYLVAPATSIVPGVLPGSQGPLLYPTDEVGRDPSIWDGMPIVAPHPTVNGQPVSARNPKVLESFGIGTVYASSFDSKLTHELWFDVEHVRKVDPRILNRLESGQPIEISTGLYVRQESGAGVHNGKEYQAVARDYRPDHIAVLMDAKGACSIEAGCGVFNEAKDMSETRTLWKRLGELIMSAAPTANVKPNEPSHADIREKLQTLIRERFGGGMKMDAYGMQKPDCCIEAVFDKEVIFEKDEKYYSLGYTSDLRTGEVKLADAAPVEVKEQTTYKPVTNETPTPESTTGPEQTPLTNGGDMPLTPQQREEHITYLTTNCDCGWKPEDREVLNKLPDDNLVRLKTQAERSKPAPTTNATPATAPVAKPLTEAEWLAAAPASVQSAVKTAQAIEQTARANLIATLTANAAETQKEALTSIYAGMPTEQLHLLANAQPQQPARPAAPPWLGAAGGLYQPAPVVNAVDQSDTLDLDAHRAQVANSRKAQ